MMDNTTRTVKFSPIVGLMIGLTAGTIVFGLPIINYNLQRIATQLELLDKLR